MIGACPSEYSSAASQKMGCIDRIGNPELRAMSVEAVWRLKGWNPTWRGFVKFPEVLAAPGTVGAARRKKAVVACARLLMVDMWRIETGRIQLSDVGLVA
jgi:transposase